MSVTSQDAEIFRFGGFRLVPSTRTLSHGGTTLPLGGRALDLLLALVTRAGQVVSKEELFALVWPHSTVEESNLRVHVAALRRALGDGSGGTRLIANISGRGYSFIAAVEHTRLGADEMPAAEPASPYRPDPPAPLVGLIGRDAEVSKIVAELPQRRLLTIAGAGGIGKTALALAAAERLAGTYRDGIRFVDLAPLTSRQLVPGHIASLLRLPVSDSEPLPRLIDHLRDRQLLLVLDNCEHLIDEVGADVAEILRWAPFVQFLCTSREPLRVAGEWIHRLTPLGLPPDGVALTLAEGLAFPAVQLLVERVRACNPSFPFTDADTALLIELCTRLDGLPLAIELAAVRISAFGLRGVAERLDDRFNLLTKGQRTADPRHQTLGATIAWSYDTLSDAEKTLWQRLSLFCGPFSLEAASAVGQEGVLDGLDSLIEKSLLSVEADGDEIRYRMLESTRLYGFEKLRKSGEMQWVRQRHAQYFRSLALGAGGGWADRPSADWLHRHASDMAEIRNALDWAFASPHGGTLAITLTAASAPFWIKFLLVREFRSYLEHATALAAAMPEIGDDIRRQLQDALDRTEPARPAARGIVSNPLGPPARL